MGPWAKVIRMDLDLPMRLASRMPASGFLACRSCRSSSSVSSQKAFDITPLTVSAAGTMYAATPYAFAFRVMLLILTRLRAASWLVVATVHVLFIGCTRSCTSSPIGIFAVSQRQRSSSCGCMLGKNRPPCERKTTLIACCGSGAIWRLLRFTCCVARKCAGFGRYVGRHVDAGSVSVRSSDAFCFPRTPFVSSIRAFDWDLP